MVIHIYFKKLTLIWLSDLENKDKVSINFETNLRLRFDYIGDSSKGPGFSNLEIELDILKGFEKSFTFKSAEKQPQELNENPILDPSDVKLRKVSTKEGTSVRDKRKKQKRETSPSKTVNPETPNTGNMIENVTLLFQQRYEIKTSTRHFQEEKADYITKMSLIKRNDDIKKTCDFNIPVVLLNKLNSLFKVVSSYSAEKVIPSKFSRPPHKSKETTVQKDDSYNQIYEVSIPSINIILLSEYKGEELIKIEVKDVFMYFRTEQKKTPKVNQESNLKGELISFGVNNKVT